MRNYEKTDILFYRGKETTGDLLVGDDGDFILSDQRETIAQDIQNRMRTQRTDWMFHPEIGADLELYIGQMNSEEIALSMSMSIYRTLTYDGLVSFEDVEVDIVPISANELEVFIFLTTTESEEPYLVFDEIIKL